MRTTIWDVAKEAGVSVSTVSYALKKTGPVTKATHLRVLEAVQRLNYVPDATARSLVRGRTNSVGLVAAPMSTLDFRNPYVVHVLATLSTLLASKGYWMSLYMPRHSEEASLRRFLEGASIDGLIWLGGPIPLHMEKALDSRDLPRVSVEYGGDFSHQGSAVLLDDYAGITAAMDYLYSLGHHTILFVGGRPADEGRGIACLARASQLPGCTVMVADGGFTEDGAYGAVRPLVSMGDLGFTAVLAASDLMALGALRALADAGVAVPEAVSVMGFDDIPEAAKAKPPLTTMAQPVEAMMRAACDHLFACIDGTNGSPALQRRVLPELVVRASTTPPKPKSQPFPPREA